MKTSLASLLSLVGAGLVAGCGSVPGDSDDIATASASLSTSITWRASSLAALDQSTGPAISIAVSTPVGTLAGDVEIAAITSYGYIAITGPAGWTLLDSPTDSGTTVANASVRTWVYSHVAGASEPLTDTFTFDKKARAVVSIQSYSNVDPTNPIDVEASALESTVTANHATPAIATKQAGDVLVGIYGIVNPHEPASATSAMGTERCDRSSGNAGSWGIDLAIYDSAPLAAAGNVAGQVATSSSATDQATMTVIALRPKNPKTLFGAAFTPRDDAHFDARIAQWGGMGADRSYDGTKGVGMSSPWATDLAQDVARGVVTAYSFKYQPADVTNGAWDSTLHDFFTSFPDNHAVYWTYWHEPDDEIYKSHQFTAPQYRAAWAHIRTIFDSVKATRPNMKAYATFIMMEWSLTPAVAPGRPLLGDNGMWPGNDVIDVFGIDVYNEAFAKGGVSEPSSQFDAAIAFAASQNKPWAIGEIGSCPVANDPSGRATYLQNAIQYWISKDTAPTFVTYFDVDYTANGACDYRIDSDPAATSVWHTAVTQGLGGF